MKKIILTILLLFSLTQISLSQSQDHAISFGPYVGLKTHSLVNVLGFNASYSHRIMEKFYTRLNLSGQTADSRISSTSSYLNVFSIELSALYKPFNSPYQPYAGIGIGCYIPRESEGSSHGEAPHYIDPYTIHKDSRLDNSTTAGANLYAGLYLFNYNYLEIKYALFMSNIIKEYTSQVKGNYTETSSVTIDTFSISFGFAIRF